MEECEPGVDVPSTFEPLIIGKTQAKVPRDPGCVGASTYRRVGTALDLDVTEPIVQCALSLRPPSTIFKRVPYRSLGADANFSFELTGRRGAALTTRGRTYKEDAQLDLRFKKYTKRNYKSWVEFARDKEYGENLRPVLVSGFDMTKDFAMMAYSNNSSCAQAGATISTPMFASAPAPAWGEWRTECTPYFKHGPQDPRPPDLPPLLSRTGNPPTEFNQCVFIRYYTMRLELGIFPRVIRGGAGPHDLGPGENERDAFPELTARSDAESMSDKVPGGLRDLVTNDTGFELDAVIRNVLYVRFPERFFCFRSDIRLVG